MSGGCPPHHLAPYRRRSFHCDMFVMFCHHHVSVRGGVVRPTPPPSRWWLLVCGGYPFVVVAARVIVHLFGKDIVGSYLDPCSPVTLEVALP
ncbi:hypothetical protein A2U01_0026723 [Trifolium medium]|uniref:Uncharacterized protein n=1 Tax=Trifolium medium TaxID=97028 RepID=A0A392P2E6_9FABA|nr:hypothetical protein [Trifolium medium]